MVVIDNGFFWFKQKSQTRTIIVLITILMSSLFLHLPQLTAQQLSSTVSTPSNSSIVSSPTSIPASLSLINCSLGKPPADPIDMNT